MRVLDLFSGIGGFSLGFERSGMKTVAFCECEKFCQQVLKKHWPDIPCHDDVTTLDGKQYDGSIDVVCGGYPCQPFSTAGKRGGHEDERHLWPEMLRIIQGCRPRWVVAENVAGHLSLGFDEVVASLEAEGFTVWPFIIPACAVDAPHRRDRLWIVANTNSGWRGTDPSRRDDSNGPDAGRKKTDSLLRAICQTSGESFMADAARERRREAWEYSERQAQRTSGSSEILANTDTLNAQGQLYGSDDAHLRQEPIERQIGLRNGAGRNRQWEVEPNVGRVAHGVSRRVDRLRALGNSIIPQIAEAIGQAIMQYEGVMQCGN